MHPLQPFTNNSNPKISILGGVRSGIGAALLAQQKNYKPFVSDFGQISAKNKGILQNAQIPFEEGQHDVAQILKSDVVVKSPGVPETAPIVQQIKAANIPLLSEIEFASLHTNAEIIAITGSNGKTTTTSLVYHLLKTAGLSVNVAGNIGNSFSHEIVKQPQDFDYYVLEVSSFQLDNIQTFQPKIAILLNITPDHLDRYNYSFDEYAQAKLKITSNQNYFDHLIYCADDETINHYLARYKKEIQANLHPFSLNKIGKRGVYVRGEQIELAYNQSLPIHQLRLKGKHNVYNAMAAGIVGSLLGIDEATMIEAYRTFNNLEHRLEPVVVVNGVQFINDSKATNIDSVWYALDAMNQPIVWIAGGVDKGNHYPTLAPLVEEKVKAIVCLGKDNTNIHQAFDNKVSTIINTQSAQQAVEQAYTLAQPGDVVLLSPACASFDLFNNYEDRGKQFKEAVYKLSSVVHSF